MKWTNRLGKSMFVGAAWTATALVVGAAGTGCLSRPVGQQPPTTKVNFTSTVSQQAVDKVDLLFAIDNSSSMGDKQAILKDAVPNLIQGLLRPKCISSTDQTPDPNGSLSDPTSDKDHHYGCPDGFEPEFKPVTDMHIGIVSSSLGSFGGDVCPSSVPRQDDRGHLINLQKGAPDPLAPSGFLAWFPDSPENTGDEKRHPVPASPIKTLGDPTKPEEGGLIPNFQDLVVGVGQDGCGLEAQLESVYRFLVQPDPWDVVKLNNFNQADLGDGVDTEVLKERKDFLRPDSLVAIIMLTDEDDSSSDPLAVGGQGWAFMTKNFPGSEVKRGAAAQGKTAPRGTVPCDTDPGSADCTSCGFQTLCDPTTAFCQKIKQDAHCAESGDPSGQHGPLYDGYYAPTDDELNVRFHRMKQRYGIDPQYPIRRYTDGLQKPRVPDRIAEHITTVDADGRRTIAEYSSTPKCTNPLFAAALPNGDPGEELCLLPRSTRSADLVFFAVVGGVPNQLLHFTPNDPDKSRITNEDWVKIIGKDPGKYDLSGIDPHMVQSVAPRTNEILTSLKVCGDQPCTNGLGENDLPRGQNGADTFNGREWNTEKKDLQYACTFPLPVERKCGLGDRSCDCAPDTTFNPPLCKDGGDGNPVNSTQTRAKAYPSAREFQVVRALGEQGVIASLCPIQLTDPEAADYGYKPAVAAIIDRLKNALTTQCLPQKLRETSDGGASTDPALPVPCLVLAQLSAESGKDCKDFQDETGAPLAPPEKAILDVFLQQQKAESGNVGDGGLDLSTLKVCVVPQKPVALGDSCAKETAIEWCYVENNPGANKTPAGRCPQALIFSSGSAALVGARFSLQCIQQFSAGQAAGDTTPPAAAPAQP